MGTLPPGAQVALYLDGRMMYQGAFIGADAAAGEWSVEVWPRPARSTVRPASDHWSIGWRWRLRLWGWWR